MTSLWNDGSVDCPICGECRAFTVSSENEAEGFCSAENKVHTIQWSTVICGVCGRETLRLVTTERHNAAGRLERICNRHV